MRPTSPRDLPCSPPDTCAAAATLPVLSGPALGRGDSQAPKTTALLPRTARLFLYGVVIDYGTCPRGTQSFRDVPDTVVSLSWPCISILHIPSSLQTWQCLSHCPLLSPTASFSLSPVSKVSSGLRRHFSTKRQSKPPQTVATVLQGNSRPGQCRARYAASTCPPWTTTHSCDRVTGRVLRSQARDGGECCQHSCLPPPAPFWPMWWSARRASPRGGADWQPKPSSVTHRSTRCPGKPGESPFPQTPQRSVSLSGSGGLELRQEGTSAVRGFPQ